MKKRIKAERLILLKLILGVVLIVFFIVNSCLLMGAYWSYYQTRSQKSFTITSPITETKTTFTLQNTVDSTSIPNPTSQQIVDMITAMRLADCRFNAEFKDIKTRYLKAEVAKPTGTLLFKAHTEYDVWDLNQKEYYASEKETINNWGAFIFFRDLYPWNSSRQSFDSNFTFCLRRNGERWQSSDSSNEYRKVCFKNFNGVGLGGTGSALANYNPQIMINYWGGRYQKIKFDHDMYSSNHLELAQIYDENKIGKKTITTYINQHNGNTIQKEVVYHHDYSNPDQKTIFNAYWFNDQKNYVCFYTDIDHQNKVLEIYFNTTNPMISPIAKIIRHTDSDEKF